MRPPEKRPHFFCEFSSRVSKKCQIFVAAIQICVTLQKVLLLKEEKVVHVERKHSAVLLFSAEGVSLRWACSSKRICERLCFWSGLSKRSCARISCHDE